MKQKIIIAIVIAFVLAVVFIANKIRKIPRAFSHATGVSLHSAAGAHTRGLEYAKESGNEDYIAKAKDDLAFIDSQLSQWRRSSARFSFDQGEFDAARRKAYDTTDASIKKGINPFADLDKATELGPKPTD